MILNDEGLPSVEISLDDLFQFVKGLYCSEPSRIRTGSGTSPPVKQVVKASENIPKKTRKRRKKSIFRRFKTWIKHKLYRIRKALRRSRSRRCRSRGSVRPAGRRGKLPPMTSGGGDDCGRTV